MSEKKSSGCIVAAIIGAVVLVVTVVLVITLTFRGVRAGKEVVSQQIERHREESARAAAKAESVQPVRLDPDQLPDFSGYQAGQPLSREMFLAWKVDRQATSLARETFREKIEGAEVTWVLRAGDLHQVGDRIIGDFYLPYVVEAPGGRGSGAGAEAVRCEFSATERESLLGIRRDHTAEIRGQLSLAGGDVRLLGARLAGTEVEKE